MQRVGAQLNVSPLLYVHLQSESQKGSVALTSCHWQAISQND
jgi:hypothetical protein